MGAFKDLTGRRFGKLVVISRAENHGKATRWNCVCDCGGVCTVFGSNLKRGTTKSCGCGQFDAFIRYNAEHTPDLTGRVFGRLKVLHRDYSNPEHRKGCAKWLCKCECGKEKVITSQELLRGDSQSCGCLHDELCGERALKHGLCKPGKRDPRYARLFVLHTRCYNQNSPSYKDYGGRGIGICYEWNLYDNPENALCNWISFCDASGFRKDLTIERKDVNKDYSPDNCCWMSLSEQSNNKRTSIRLSNGNSLVFVLKNLGIISNTIEDHAVYSRVCYFFRKHNELPEWVVQVARGQNKLHLIEEKP